MDWTAAPCDISVPPSIPAAPLAATKAIETAMAVDDPDDATSPPKVSVVVSSSSSSSIDNDNDNDNDIDLEKHNNDDNNNIHMVITCSMSSEDEVEDEETYHRDAGGGIERVPLLRSLLLKCVEGPLAPDIDNDDDDIDQPTVERKERRRRVLQHSEIVCAIISVLAIILGIVLIVSYGTPSSTGVPPPPDHGGSSAPGPPPTPAPQQHVFGGGDGGGRNNNTPPTVAEHPPPTLPRLSNKPCGNAIPHPPLMGKKGAAFTLRDNESESGSWVENLPKVIALNPYWNYSWGTKRIAQQPDNIEFIPMVWGHWEESGTKTTIRNDVLPQWRDVHIKRLLGFNEPDYERQSNLPVESALAAWPLLEETDLPLISPSCAHPEREWMQTFATVAAEECLRMEWVGVHWYGGVSFNEFKTDMETFYEMYRRPLLVTEFAPADWSATSIADHQFTDAKVLAFMKQALPWLEATPWIAGYAWFSFERSSPAGTSSALFNRDGGMTTCGRYYASVTNNSPKGDMLIGTDQDIITTLSAAPMLRSGTKATTTCATTATYPEPEPLPGKKGGATILPKLSLLNVSWNHNWGATAVDDQPEAVEYVPTIWGGWTVDGVTEQLQAEVVPHLAANGGLVKRLLAFHAPDSASQSNMTVSRALELWPALESLDVPLISPACTNPNGEWLEGFMAGAASQCRRVDWVSVRWSGAPDFATFKSDLVSLYEKFKKPLLLTGMEPVTTDDIDSSAVLAFMKQALPWLELTDYIRGYVWMAKVNTAAALFNADHSLTACGRYYASISPSSPQGNQSI